MIEILMLGELQVKRDGAAVPLPPSRKTRALLGYLAVTGRPHLRERLCSLLWEGPDDPRAALRWSVAKLRPLVEPHLLATRDRVELRYEAARIDAQILCPPATATLDLLEQSAALFRGELLEGLDLAACFRYQQWVVGERERFRQLQIAILTELIKRHGKGEAALGHARRRVMIDPFNEAVHAALIRSLAELGQSHEALRQYDHCRELFERELGTRPGAVVEQARRLVGTQPAVATTVAPSLKLSSSFVGRAFEITRARSSSDPILVLGEPGIGKSRLIEELRALSGGRTIYGRAFAAEMVRPYGVWLDALREFPHEGDRARLFETIACWIADVTLIAIDDLQWIDEASAALLHFIARTTPTRIICAARVGEVDDNPHAMRLIHELRLTTIALGPLTDDETRALVPDERIVRLSGGNPLFALELARSGSNEAAPVMSMIARRLAELTGPGRELVAWAAAIGRQFDVEIAGRATGMPAGEMLGALDKLERSAIIRASGDRGYDFAHDLVRDAAYQMLTGPRRMLVHRHIARALREAHDPDGALAGDLVHHASLAGEHEVAADAAVASGKRCLRLFAYSEAMGIARRGLQIAESLSGDNRMESEMRLLHIIVLCRTPVSERVPYAGRIAEATELARRAGLAKTAALGAHLLAILYEETNNYGGAADATRQSAEISRSADPATAALSMAMSARCLLLLQRDVSRAEDLLAQAQAIGLPSPELSLALGFLHAHQGRAVEAVPHLERAWELAAARGDHWSEWIALARLVTLALEEGDPALALRHCARLHLVAAKMHGGSESVRSEVFECVARHALGEAADIETAIARLREIDSKSDIAWVLSYLAEHERDRERSQAFATEALQAAEAVGRTSEAIIARKILGQPAKATRDISARARQFLKERRHGHHGARTVI
jgi:DNA-binding SARP family transcriptional activator/tetratricopeptide (TPR) repeat protein